MTNKKLIDILRILPKDANIYIESDHGQVPEPAYHVNVSSDEELPYRGDEIDWDSIDDVPKHTVTAILIS